MNEEIKNIIEKFGAREIENSLQEFKYFEYLEKGFDNVKSKFGLNDIEAVDLINNFLDHKNNVKFDYSKFPNSEFIGKQFNISNPKLIKVIEELFFGLEEIKLEEYPNRFFYFKNGKCHLEYDRNFNSVFIEYDRFTLVLNNDFNYDYNQIKNLGDSIIEKVFNLKNVKIEFTPYNQWNVIELNYNPSFKKVQQAFKNVRDELGIFSKLITLNLNFIEFIDDYFINLEEVKSDKYISYLKDGKCNFEYDVVNNFVNIVDDFIWNIFQTTFGLSYKDTNYLIKTIIENVYNLNDVTIGSKERINTSIQKEEIKGLEIEFLCKKMNIDKPELIQIIKDILIGLRPVGLNKRFNHTVYINKKNEDILYWNSISKYLYIRYDILWHPFEQYYRHDEILKFMNFMVSSLYGLNPITIFKDFCFNFDIVEDK